MFRGKICFVVALIAIVSSLIISGCVSPPTGGYPTPKATPAQTPAPAGVAVEIKNFAYDPITITVPIGTTVTWTNNDSVPHTVTSDTFDSGRISPGGTFSYTFNAVGTFEYRCTIHPRIPHGSVIVTSPGASPMPAPTPTPTPTSVEVVSAPATAAAGQSFTVSWRVNSPIQETINNTAVYYGPASKSEPLTLSSYPSFTAPQSGTIPNSFSTNITIGKTGIFYFRAHAIINGTDYWSAEKSINVTIPTVTSVKVTPTVTTTPYSYGGYY